MARVRQVRGAAAAHVRVALLIIVAHGRQSALTLREPAQHQWRSSERHATRRASAGYGATDEASGGGSKLPRRRIRVAHPPWRGKRPTPRFERGRLATVTDGYVCHLRRSEEQSVYLVPAQVSGTERTGGGRYRPVLTASECRRPKPKPSGLCAVTPNEALCDCYALVTAPGV